MMRVPYVANPLEFFENLGGRKRNTVAWQMSCRKFEGT